MNMKKVGEARKRNLSYHGTSEKKNIARILFACEYINIYTR